MDSYPDSYLSYPDSYPRRECIATTGYFDGFMSEKSTARQYKLPERSQWDHTVRVGWGECSVALGGGGFARYEYTVTFFDGFITSEAAADAADRRPSRPVAEPHGGLRVSVRRPGTVRRWQGCSAADFEPRSLAVALTRPKTRARRRAARVLFIHPIVE